MEVQGHRGARARYPENTIPAFEYALQVGVDVLELDMAITQDGKIVVSHDPHISAKICLNAKGRKLEKEPLIHELTLAQVKTYDCGTLINPRFPHQRPVSPTQIPTLEEVFKYVKDSKHPVAKKVRFNIETKSFADHPEYTVAPAEFAKRVIAVVKKHHMMNRVILQSFDYRTLEEARKIEPKIVIAALSETKGEDLVASAKKLNANICSPDFEMISGDTVKKLHDIGVQVVPWTLNTPEDWKKAIDMNVDGIITDDPGELISFLKKK